MLRLNHKARGWVNNEVLRNHKNPYLLSSEIKIKNSNASMCFIPLHKVRKHKEYNVCDSKVELKLTDYPCLGGHSTHSCLSMEGGCRHPSMSVCHKFCSSAWSDPDWIVWPALNPGLYSVLEASLSSRFPCGNWGFPLGFSAVAILGSTERYGLGQDFDLEEWSFALFLFFLMKFT